MKDIDIKHIKLSNGEEIVSFINSIKGDDVILEFPLMLNSVYNNNSTYTYYFTRFMNLTNDNIIHLNTRNIIAYSTVSDEIKERYIRASLNYKEDRHKEENRVNKEIEKRIRDNINSIMDDEEYEYDYETDIFQHTLH